MILLNNPYGIRSTLTCALKIIRSNTQRKHFGRWIKSLETDYLLNTPSPWLVFDAIDFIAARLPSQAKVFEYGSGGSTLYWLSRGATCVSIEHDPAWYETLRGRLPTGSSVDYRLIVPEKTDSKSLDPSEPRDYASGDENFVGYSFQKYVAQIDDFPDEYFDLVVIDGRARPASLLHSVRKTKKNGAIVLDNSDRSYYLARTKTFLDRFRENKFYGVGPAAALFSQTSVYSYSS